jgi:hypothetical protein
MTRALALSQRQAQTLLRAADAERGIVEVKIGNTVFRLIPECLAQESSKVDRPITADSFDTLDDYLAWRDRSGAGGT